MVSENKPAGSRILSGMRSSGSLHLGHYHGVLKNWLKLQHEYECYFFVADWHALTTNYDDTSKLEEQMWSMVIDWLAVGINPKVATVFVQSRVPEHAELLLLLSMITPLGWLERVPTYKEQQEKLKEKDLATYGFLGYPLLQAADILMYKADAVPVGDDQVAHVELTREIARRFNYVCGREPDFELKAKRAIRKLGGEKQRIYQDALTKYQERGDADALAAGQAMIEAHPNLTVADRERLLGYIEGSGRTILVEPQALLTEVPKLPGLDGQKMSKSYGNTISLREDTDVVAKNIKKMPTDPARVRRSDPGDPEKCPVWEFHKIYSDKQRQEWVQTGCRTAGIGCIDCKKPVIDAVIAELEPIQARAAELEANPDMVRSIVTAGSERA
ncbi:MAG: tryptophan--tRNA ligase, partial [Gammaproteobacteria bacterium]|nr:tryptophan--tRNA ligase [Gammaproteobacteria bacterium]